MAFFGAETEPTGKFRLNTTQRLEPFAAGETIRYDYPLLLPYRWGDSRPQQRAEGMYCSNCGAEVSSTDIFCSACGFHLADTKKYFPVTLLKFIVLSVSTFNIYLLYWFWKNWRYVKERDKSSIIPWARSLFSIIWYYFLLADIYKHQDKGKLRLGFLPVLAFAYFLLVAGTSKLPDPYWLISLLSFVPLLPAVIQIKAINGEISWALQRNSAFQGRHFVLVPVGLAAVLFVSAGATNFIPNGTPITGDKLWEKDVQFIRALGVLDDDEPILVYYSSGVLSYKEDGNILTDRRLLSYTAGEPGETIYWSATFDEIFSVHIFYSDSIWNETEILVCAKNSWFKLFAGSEGKGKNRFVGEIVQRVGLGRMHTHAYDAAVECEDVGGT